MRVRNNPAELLIASNPSRRRRKQTAKQRAASLRNLRKARRSGGGKRRRRKNPVAALAGNPRRRKRRAARSFLRRIRRRRNPSFSLRTFSPRALMAKVMPALVGGGGAVANDLLFNAALKVIPPTMPFYDQLTAGPLRHVAKGISAVALATIAGLVLPRRIAEQMGTGALVVVGYNAVREGVDKFAPGTLGMYLNDGSLGYAGAGWNPTYGSEWRAKSGLAAYLKRNGNGGEPGSVSVPGQFDTRGQFGTRRGGVFAMPATGT